MSAKFSLEGYEPSTVFKLPAGRVLYGGMKPSSTDKFKKPEHGNDAYDSLPFTLSISMPEKDEDVQRFGEATTTFEKKLLEAAEAADWKDLAATEESPEVRRAILRKALKSAYARKRIDAKDPSKGFYDPTTTVKIYGWAPVVESDGFVWDNVETKDGPKRMITQVKWQVREVGTPGQACPGKDATRFLYVYDTKKDAATGKVTHRITDMVPLLDKNGQKQFKPDGSLRLRFVGPQDLCSEGARVEAYVRKNTAWSSSAGMGASQVATQVVIFPGTSQSQAPPPGTKIERPSASNVDEMIKVMQNAAAAADTSADDPGAAPSFLEHADDDEYAAAGGDDEPVEHAAAGSNKRKREEGAEDARGEQ